MFAHDSGLPPSLPIGRREARLHRLDRRAVREEHLVVGRDSAGDRACVRRTLARAPPSPAVVVEIGLQFARILDDGAPVTGDVEVTENGDGVC